jgi:hypothetical protein
MKEVNKALEIWEEIKDTKISMFALPLRPISYFVEPNLTLPLDELYVKQKVSTAFLPIMEEAIGKTFEIIPQDKGWLIIKRVAPKPKLS